MFLCLVMTVSLVNGTQNNTITDRLLSDARIMRTERIMSVVSASIALFSMSLAEDNKDYDSYISNGFIVTQAINVVLNGIWYMRKKEPIRLLHTVPTLLCFSGIVLDNYYDEDEALIPFAIGSCGVIAKGCYDSFSLIKDTRILYV